MVLKADLSKIEQQVNVPSPVKTAAINVAPEGPGAGTEVLIAAVAGKSIRVLSYHLQSLTAATAIKFQNSGGGDLTGPLQATTLGDQLQANAGRWGVCETNQGDGLTGHFSGATTLQGWIRYVEV